MINKEKLAEVRTGTRAKVPSITTLLDIPEDELREMRDSITALLPEDKVSALNLENELMQQYRITKSLMVSIKDDETIPANQKAQVANAVVSTLGSLIKLQEDLRKQETLKIMEVVLIDTVRTLPQETKDEFFAEFERRAKKAKLL